jgi:hypothetical protein
MCSCSIFSPFHSLSQEPWALRKNPFVCVKWTAHCLSVTFVCVKWTAHCVCVTFVCVKWTAHCVSVTFVCVKWTAHCLSVTSVDSMFCCHRHLARYMKVQFKVCAELSVECPVKGKGSPSVHCEGVWWIGGIEPLSLSLGTRRKLAVSFVPWLF